MVRQAGMPVLQLRSLGLGKKCELRVRYSAFMSRERTCRSRRSRSNFSTDARICRIPDEAFTFQMKDDLLCRLVRGKSGGIDGDVRISWFFVGIRDTGKLLDNTGPGFGVETFAIAFFANFNRSGEMHHDESAQRRNHAADFFPHGIVRSDGRTDGDALIFGDLGSDVSNASDVKVAMFAGKTEFGRQMLTNEIAVKKRDRPAPDFEELNQQDIGNG